MADLEKELLLIQHLADNIREGNYLDQRLHLLRHIDRVLAALPKAGAEPVGCYCGGTTDYHAFGCPEAVAAPPTGDELHGAKRIPSIETKLSDETREALAAIDRAMRPPAGDSR